MSEELTVLHAFTDAWFLKTQAFYQSRQQQKHDKSEGHLERLNIQGINHLPNDKL
jgi:hypothetical protein